MHGVAMLLRTRVIIINSAPARGARRAPRAGGEVRPPQGPPEPPEGSRFFLTYVRKFTQYAILIRSSCEEHRNKHRQNLQHLTAWVSAHRSTLRNLLNVEIIRFALLSPQISLLILALMAACSNSPSLSHVLLNSCAIQLLYNAIKAKTKHLAGSLQCLLLAPCKGIVENNGRFTKDVRPLCQINALFPVRQRQPHQDLNACHRKLAASGSLDAVLGREPELALGSLLHSNH